MKLKYILLLFLTGSLTFSCEEEPGNTPAPSGLSFEVQENAASPTAVTINISSQNTSFYKIYFGEGDNQPFITEDNSVDYTYAAPGSYTIKVQAHATGTIFISQTKQVSVGGDGGGNEGGNGEIPSEGYTTPESYEGMQLVWQDEFNGSQLNGDDWSFETGTGANGWGNNELQYYRKENTSLEDGYLIITAKKEAYQGREYTSSRIVTQGKQSFQYGRIDIRAALPKGQGIWPALWMLGSSFSEVGWPASGELDIMEMIGGGAGRDNTVHGTVHWSHGGEYASYGQGYALPNGIFADNFHVFSIVWDASSITWYVDDVEFNKIDITSEELSEFQQEFFFIFNVAVGGNWPGSPNENTTFPQRMVVDYVRVFQAE